MIVFDIETGGLPEDQLRALLPPFDPSEVKLGNLKDEAKIAAKLAEAEANHWQDFVGRAALSALTGRVLAIGYRSEKACVISHVDAVDGAEMMLVDQFWAQYRRCKSGRRNMVGHNIAGFDVPFLIRRSWLLGVDIPDGIFDANWRYLDRTFVDTMQRWQAGNYRDTFVGLDRLGKALGIGGKTEGVDGAVFSRLYYGSQDERAKALEYLIRDVELTWAVALKLGVV
jgi:3'-5' exonuclease